MAHLLLLHSAAGLRPAVRRMADRLEAVGHTVTTPDLYDGRTFTDLDEGVAHMEAIGWPELLRRGAAAAADLPADLVYAGMSMGAGIAATLATERPGARGVVLLYGPDVPEEPWPAGVPAQAHYGLGDPWIDEGTGAAFLEHVARAGGHASLHVYPASGHLLDDDDLPDQYDAAAAPLVLARIEAFLAVL